MDNPPSYKLSTHYTANHAEDLLDIVAYAHDNKCGVIVDVLVPDDRLQRDTFTTMDANGGTVIHAATNQSRYERRASVWAEVKEGNSHERDTQHQGVRSIRGVPYDLLPLFVQSIADGTVAGARTKAQELHARMVGVSPAPVRNRRRRNVGE